MTDKYAALRAALNAHDDDPTDSSATGRLHREARCYVIRALLTDYDEAERALVLTGKVNKDLMDAVLKLRKFIENEARKAERGGRVSLAKRCRAALAQEQEAKP